MTEENSSQKGMHNAIKIAIITTLITVLVTSIGTVVQTYLSKTTSASAQSEIKDGLLQKNISDLWDKSCLQQSGDHALWLCDSTNGIYADISTIGNSVLFLDNKRYIPSKNYVIQVDVMVEMNTRKDTSEELGVFWNSTTYDEQQNTSLKAGDFDSVSIKVDHNPTYEGIYSYGNIQQKILLNQFYKLKIEVIDNAYRVYIDDSLVLTNPCRGKGNRIGLFSNGYQVKRYFKNFSYTCK